jgi:hypothetical protein
MDNIILTDIDGLYNIDIRTPIIIVHNISIEYLIHVYNNVYNVNTRKVYNLIKHQLCFFNKFIPIGQIKKNTTSLYNIVYANINIFQYASIYKEIKQNIWIGIKTHYNITYQTIGTIMSITYPKQKYPVFPINLLVKRNFKLNNIYKDIYSDMSYGTWKLDNINTTKFKMIDSSGNYNTMNVPTDIINYNKNNKYYKIKNTKFRMIENSNPWYYNTTIMGNASKIHDAYKITGTLEDKIKIEKYENISNNTNSIVIYVVCIILLLLIFNKRFI